MGFPIRRTTVRQRWKGLTAFLAKGVAPGEVEPFANGSVVLVAIPLQLHNCGVSACWHATYLSESTTCPEKLPKSFARWTIRKTYASNTKRLVFAIITLSKTAISVACRLDGNTSWKATFKKLRKLVKTVVNPDALLVHPHSGRLHYLHIALHNSLITDANYKCKIITNDLNHGHKYKPKIFTNAFQLRHKYKHKVPSSCASWWRGLLTLTHWWNPLPHASLARHTALHNWPLPLYIPHNKHWHTYSMQGCISKSIA